MILRPAEARDAGEISAIYRPIVEATHISFELVPPSEEEIARRMAAIQKDYPWLVCEVEGRVAGYAYGSKFRERAAYRPTVETTVYVKEEFRGKGIARHLYRALFDELAQQGFHTAIAGISLPNEASVALHKAVGFQEAGVFPEVGWKFDRWWDVMFMTRLTNPRRSP